MNEHARCSADLRDALDEEIIALLDAFKAHPYHAETRTFTKVGGEATPVQINHSSGSPCAAVPWFDFSSLCAPAPSVGAPWGWWWGSLMRTGSGTLRVALRAGAGALRLVRARAGACTVKHRGRGAVAAAVAQTQKL